jgi:hypothetical protein
MKDRAGSSELSRDSFIGLLDDDAMVSLRTRMWCQEDVFRSGATIWLGQGVRDKPHFAQHVTRARWLAAVPTDVKSTVINLSGRISMYFQCISHGLAFGRYFAYFQKISLYLPALRAAGEAQVHKAVGSGEALARMQEQHQINISP